MYLTKLPVLGGAHGTRVAYLTSLLEVTVSNIVEKVSVRLLLTCDAVICVYIGYVIYLFSGKLIFSLILTALFSYCFSNMW